MILGLDAKLTCVEVGSVQIHILGEEELGEFFHKVPADVQLVESGVEDRGARTCVGDANRIGQECKAARLISHKGHQEG